MVNPIPNLTHEEAVERRHREIFDTRNIRDEYKNMRHEDIVESLESTSCDLVALLNNSIKDFNWGTVVRNANGFNLREVDFCGRKAYDRRGTVGAHHYTFVNHRESIIDGIEYWREKGYRIVAAEYDENYPMSSLNDYSWDRKSAIVFGEEGVSLPSDVLDIVDDIVYIPMYGTVRSFNVGTASGIFMNSYRSAFA